MEASLRRVKAKSLIKLMPAPRNYVILRGGLGNQLHQIAAGVALSEKNSGVTRIFAHAVDRAQDPTRRGYFRQVNLSGLFPSANLKEVNFLENVILVVLLKLKLVFFNRLVVNEENFEYFSNQKSISLLRGWFQSPAYLPFGLRPEVLSESEQDYKVGITLHVRLTDFASIDKNPLTSNYYERAFDLLPDSLKTSDVFCFSDDIAGASRILKKISKLQFPEKDQELNPAELLARLSSASFLIASRSSLCNWASFAVIRNGGFVVSPFTDHPFVGNWLSASD